jgi:hypothetical protein
MQIHWLAMIAAAVAGFAVGGIWYGPLFGKAWMAARGIAKEDTAGMNMPLIFGSTFLLNLFSAFMLDHLYNSYDAPVGLHHSLVIAAIIAIGFIIPAMGVNYLFSRLSRGLFLIDAGYWLVVYLAMGGIFGLLS